jgi:hypothetical protein
LYAAIDSFENEQLFSKNTYIRRQFRTEYFLIKFPESRPSGIGKTEATIIMLRRRTYGDLYITTF